MDEVFENILLKIQFSKKELFLDLLKKCLHISNETTKSTYATHDNVAFKVDTFFAGFPTFINEFGKDKQYESAVEALSVICEEIGLEVEKSECFILYHIRDLGKFKLKEAKLLQELKVLWQQYKHYTIEDGSFTRSLYNLEKFRFIEYRRGCITLNRTVIIRYK